MANIGVNSMPKTYKTWANGYRALVDTSFKKGKDYRAGIFYQDTTELWEDRIVEIGNIDDFSVFNDGERAKQTSIKEGYAKTFIQVPFGQELPIGRIFNKFQGKDVSMTSRASSKLGNKAYRQLQREPFSMLAYAFQDTNDFLTKIIGSTVSALGPDGRRFASVLHPASPVNPQTWSNVLPNNDVVGEVGLKNHILNLYNQLDDKGERKMYGDQGYIWLVPLDQFDEASRVVGSEKRNGTTDNDMNIYKGAFDGHPIEVRWVPWLNDFPTTWATSAHYLVAKDAVEDMGLCMFESEAFYTDDYIDDSTKTVYVRGQMIHSVGFLSGRGVSCSIGTGTGTYVA